MYDVVPPQPDWVRYGRRLADKLLIAFHHACDEGEYTLAEHLLKVLEKVVLRNPPEPERRQRVLEPLISAHMRLWHLRHPIEPELPGGNAQVSRD